MNKRLVILSVPNIRIARVLLNDHILGAVKDDADIVVATPFADDDAFRNEYRSSKLGFFPIKLPKQQPRLIQILYSLSELMRTVAFYRRNRRRGLQYYWSIMTKQFGEDGKDTSDPWLRRLVKQLTSIVGLWRGAWKVLDWLIGRSVFRSPMLENLVGQYQEVTLVQASSWGEQDRMLAWNARRFRFRTVLVPYTTDQLWVNGYLLCNYDAVCVQGPFEEHCARNYHQVPESRMIRLGSMWFRTIDRIVKNSPELREVNQKKDKRVMLYAGVSRIYFPRESEFQAIDALITANKNGLFGESTKLVYRPYAMTSEERAEIMERYGETLLQLQWPEEVCAGLSSYSGGLITAQLLSYIQGLMDVDVLVMSHTTSLGIDAAYLGCAVVANFADNTGVLARRKTHLRFLKNGQLDFAPGTPISRSIPELVSLVQVLLHDKAEARKSGEKLVAQWDYQCNNSQDLLRTAILDEVAVEYATSVEKPVAYDME
ncbi:Uncharacterised protein [Legionella lansingensis]|uniref:Uncharacterized protein n=1 Tax=Legionella lansingensis TaxID=45067 RepID=A0A0W0VWC5_9GAMM|nr:hypothetical protein [Legionella lansingensis]KTD24322.1 hypothetical protein Llan_0461 [Legionella lansingensis]SNV51801.1 Uncharacterised protein [Legionella lansingensis]